MLRTALARLEAGARVAPASPASSPVAIFFQKIYFWKKSMQVVHLYLAVVSLPLSRRECSQLSRCTSSSWRSLPPETQWAVSWVCWPLGWSRGLLRNPQASDRRSWRTPWSWTELEELQPERGGKTDLMDSLVYLIRGIYSVLPFGHHRCSCCILVRWRKTFCWLPIWTGKQEERFETTVSETLNLEAQDVPWRDSSGSPTAGGYSSRLRWT